MISDDNSGGVRSKVLLIPSVICVIVSLIANLISSDSTSIVFGIPDTKSRPFTDII